METVIWLLVSTSVAVPLLFVTIVLIKSETKRQCIRRVRSERDTPIRYSRPQHYHERLKK